MWAAQALSPGTMRLATTKNRWPRQPKQRHLSQRSACWQQDFIENYRFDSAR
jgi:hypothetical protein